MTKKNFVCGFILVRQINNRDVVVLNRGLLLPKLDPVPIPAMWYQHAGTYLLEPPAFSCYCSEKIVRMRLEINDGVLSAIANDQQEVILVPFDHQHAYIHGIGRNAGETIWFDDIGKLHVFGNHFSKQADTDQKEVSSETESKTTDPDMVAKDIAEKIEGIMKNRFKMN